MGILKYALIVAVTAIAVKILPNLFSKQLPLHIGGHTDKGFDLVYQAFKLNFDYGWERDGASFAAYWKGRLVVNLWGGYADREANRQWREDTISVVMSVTKAVASLVAAVLVDRGHLDYDALVTDYWPEFGKNGKDNVTVKMLLSHQAGLAVTDVPITAEIIADWRKMSKIFEDQKPNWPPGRGFGYHAITHGFLVDNLVRRSDPQKRSVGEFFAQEIAKPHNIDFFIGLPYEEFYRATRIHMPVLWQTVEQLTDPLFLRFLWSSIQDHRSSEIFRRLITGSKWLVDDVTGAVGANNADILRLEIPCCHGVGTAKSLAELFSLVLQGKIIKNVDLWKRITVPHHFESDEVPSLFMKGLIPQAGYGFLHTNNSQGDYVLGHPGYGGQNIKVDSKNELTFAYMTNGLGPDMGDLCQRFKQLEKALYASLEAKKKK